MNPNVHKGELEGLDFSPLFAYQLFIVWVIYFVIYFLIYIWKIWYSIVLDLNLWIYIRISFSYIVPVDSIFLLLATRNVHLRFLQQVFGAVVGDYN